MIRHRLDRFRRTDTVSISKISTPVLTGGLGHMRGLPPRVSKAAEVSRGCLKSFSPYSMGPSKYIGTWSQAIRAATSCGSNFSCVRAAPTSNLVRTQGAQSQNFNVATINVPFLTKVKGFAFSWTLALPAGVALPRPLRPTNSMARPTLQSVYYTRKSIRYPLL